MYSVVLMAALTTGAAAPDCHFRCGGCCGCYGGWGCCGCYGGWGGCYGGCYGGWGGCYGGCFGGWGGCYGCWGGYASWGYGCAGAGCLGAYYGGMTYPGSIAPSTMGGYGTVAPSTGGEQLEAPKQNKDSNNKETSLSPSRAKLVVELPADAKLFIDDMPMKTTSGKRTFNTPALEPGQAYYYMVRIEYVRDGKPVSQTQRVIVRAGLTARADFTDRQTDAVRTVRAK